MTPQDAWIQGYPMAHNYDIEAHMMANPTFLSPEQEHGLLDLQLHSPAVPNASMPQQFSGVTSTGESHFPDFPTGSSAEDVLMPSVPSPFDMNDVDVSFAPIMNPASLTPVSSNASLTQAHEHKYVSPKVETVEELMLSPPASPQGPPELALVSALLEAWPFFRCNPISKVSSATPKTQMLYVEGLAQILESRTNWTSWTGQSLDRETQEIQLCKARVKNMSQDPREALLAIAQSFLKKAQEIHENNLQSRAGSPAGYNAKASVNNGFFKLPPSDIITFYLHSYIRCNEPYYFVPSEASDPDKLLEPFSQDNRAASLSLLFMVATGASRIATKEARSLATGLTETCRISLYDMVEKNILMAGDPKLLHAALLFITLGAWSGDKWQMDVRNVPIIDSVFGS
ncbi:MAG: hypothetical protein Q9227_003992 [Pyrenula ochraceoflavens]